MIAQAGSHLVWLLAHRHGFEALVRRRLGAGAAEAVDWRRPRVICVAGEFSRHDRAAASLYQRDYRVDLVRYRVFGPDLLTLQLVETVPGYSPSGAAAVPAAPVGEASEEPETVAVPAGPSKVEVPGCLRELYGELDEVLTSAGELEVVVLKRYIAYRRMLNVASVVFRPLRLAPGNPGLSAAGPGHGGAGGGLHP
ncbi:hypothetical protein [Streptomyces sp. NRRL S-350]|uniref:hypothetical protein n=1 Tax=Streptomyces sp. NRRL S-350 TaxID=1463902 RepID=UPI001F16DE32|nr:hypothetical protein [Streptomyces sp. NRRL S-350]